MIVEQQLGFEPGPSSSSSSYTCANGSFSNSMRDFARFQIHHQASARLLKPLNSLFQIIHGQPNQLANVFNFHLEQFEPMGLPLVTDWRGLPGRRNSLT